MKRNNKKKLPRYWLGTRRPTTLGYLPNKGIGDSLASTNPGISVRPDVLAMKQNFVPNMIGRAGSSFLFPMQMAQTFTKAAPAAANPFLTTTSAGAVNGINTGSNLGTSLFEHGAGKITQQGTTKAAGALSPAGTALGALGTAYGLYNVGTDIANAGDHRTVGNMRDTLTTNTYTTAGGSTYTEKTGLDTSGELEYENQNKRAKQMGLTLDSIGLGASAGGLVGGTALAGSIGGPLGMALGAGLGLVAGGLASLFGFGDNEDEVREQMQILGDETTRVNRQSRSEALDLDVKSAFYSGEASAANGKRPVWTPDGLVGKKATARVSNGEVVGNFEEGVATRIPGKKNNKDTKLAALSDGDFVISNKYGLSDYAAATGDYLGALNLQEMLLGKMRNKHGYKCGKLPKRALGQFGEYALSALPHLGGLMGNIARYNRAKNADTYAPDLYVEDAEGRAAVNQLANLRYDVTPYLRDAQRALNQQNWNVRRNVGLGLGGRAIAQNANFLAYLNNLANVYNAKNEADNKYTAMYADALAKLGAQNRQYRTAALNNQFQWKQQQNAAKENWLDQVQKDKYTVASSLASDIMRVNQYNEARALENKKLGLYQQQVDIDRIKALQGLNNNSTTNTTVPTSSYYNFVSPSLEELQKLYRLGGGFA